MAELLSFLLVILSTASVQSDSPAAESKVRAQILNKYQGTEAGTGDRCLVILKPNIPSGLDLVSRTVPGGSGLIVLKGSSKETLIQEIDSVPNAVTVEIRDGLIVPGAETPDAVFDEGSVVILEQMTVAQGSVNFSIRGFEPAPMSEPVPEGLSLYDRALLRFTFDPKVWNQEDARPFLVSIEEWLKPFDHCSEALEFSQGISPPPVTAGMTMDEVERILGAPVEKVEKTEGVVIYRYPRYSILFVEGLAMQFARR